jgi:glycosyltransferase involved in cell wall biosynthesis
MKIATIVHNYLPKLGGAETILHSNLTGFLENKFVENCIVITASYKDSPAFEIIDGVKIYRFKTWAMFNHRVHLPSFDLFRIILKVMKEERPDQIHTVTRFSMHTMLGLLLSKIKGYRVVHEEYLAGHVNGESKMMNLASYLWDKIMVRFCLSFADQIVCLSQSVKTFLAQDLGLDEAKMVVIQSGCHLQADPQSYQQKFNRVKHFNLFWAARLVALKNPILALETVKILRQTRQDFSFYIAGEGPLRSEVEEFIKQNNMGSYVHYLGRLNAKQMSQQFRQNHVFLSTSTMEGLCLSVLEAIYNTNLVVSSRTGGPDELLAQVQDSFVELDQLKPEVFSQKIDFILRHLDELLPSFQKNKDRVTAYYTIERAQNQYRDWVLKAINSSRTDQIQKTEVDTE